MKIEKHELDHLAAVDADLKSLIARYGDLSFPDSINIYKDLVDTIIGQMLSYQAALTIARRVQTAVGSSDYDCEILKDLDVKTLKDCGLSTVKAQSILELARMMHAGTLDLDSLAAMEDTAVIAFLSGLKGIGTWTAEMIALFSLGKKNIFSDGDVALKAGIMKAKGYKTVSRTRMAMLKKRYAPYGSIASLYFYRCRDDAGYVR